MFILFLLPTFFTWVINRRQKEMYSTVAYPHPNTQTTTTKSSHYANPSYDDAEKGGDPMATKKNHGYEEDTFAFWTKNNE